ncbi:MAG: 2OG-Fe(II) oxygenase [Gammaproteobacteria bacterium]|nr:MAG: 2OG-Fe(II) oxygenase [Gammaproteobacteria bacterium]
MSTDFIAIYPNVLSAELCEQIITKFEKSPHRQPGVTGHGIDPEKKRSQDITISRLPEWQAVQDTLLQQTYHYVRDYVLQHPFLLVGALSPKVLDPDTQKPVSLTVDNFERLGEHYIDHLLPMMYRFGYLNVQKYTKNHGGYPHWHSEIYPQDQSCESLHRVLLFMYYLNDVSEGGETEFFYQKKKIPPTQGTLVIAPADFTHTHRGNTPVSNDKYIVTSWILFNRAEQIFGQK